jgi:pimeloyl-ACP methyl ester carboxylesterase
MTPMRILYFHGLAGSSHGEKVAELRRRFGDANVAAPSFPFGRGRLIHGGLMNLGAFAEDVENIALDAYQRFRPEVIVGQSLGTAVAMQLAAEHDLPAVLITPVWNTQLKDSYLGQYLTGKSFLSPTLQMLLPIVTNLLLDVVRQRIGFRFTSQVRPRTLLLHSPQDELFDLDHSRRLLENSPIPEGSPETAFMARVSAALQERGHCVEQGRPIVVGKDHRMDDPEALRALVDAVELLGRG